MKMKTLTTFSSLFVIMAFAATSAFAQSPGASAANDAAYALFSAGNYSEAAAAYEKLLSDYPTDSVVPLAQIQLAFSYYFLGQFDKSLELIKKITSGPPLPEDLRQVVDGLLPQVLSAQASAMDATDPKRKATFEEAIKHFDEYAKKYPQAPDLENLIYGRAIANFQIENFDAVIADMESNMQRFAQSPTLPTSKNLLALALATKGSRILNENGDQNEAFAFYKRAADLLREIIADRRDVALFNEANFQLAEILFNQAAFSEEAERGPLFAEALEAYRSIAPREEIISMQEDKIAAFPERRRAAIQSRNQALLKQLERDNIRELTKLEELKNKPDQVSSAFQKMGEIYFQQGDMNAARTVFRHVEPHLKEEEDTKRRLYFETMSYAMQGVTDKAIAGYEAFQSEYKSDPIADNLPVTIGNMLLSQGQPEQAIPYFNESLEIYPQGRFAGLSVVSKAAAESRLGQFDSAEKTFKEFIAKNPPDDVGVVARSGLANVYRETGKWADAITAYKEVIEEHPDTPQAVESQYWIGIATQQLGENENAIPLLDAFAAEHPGHPLAPLALYAKGASLIATNKQAEGMEALAAVADKYPDSQPAPFTYFMRAQYQGQQGKPDEVVDLMRAFIEKYPQDDKIFVAYESIAQTSLNAGKPEETIATYREFAGKYPQSDKAPVALHKVAELQRDAAEKLGRYGALNDQERAKWKENLDAAIATAEEVLTAYPESPEVALSLRTLLQGQRLLLGAELKKPDDVESYFEGLADSAANPGTKSKILFAFADYVGEQDAERALEIMSSAYDSAVIYSPEDLDSYGLALVSQGKHDEAQAVFEKLGADYPVPSGTEANAAPLLVQQAQATALFGKARVLQEQGKTAEAGELFARLKSLYPWSPKVLEADYGIAESLRADGQLDDAITLLGTIIRAPNATADLRANSMLLFGNIMVDKMNATNDPDQRNNFRDSAIDNFIKIAQFYGGVPSAAARGLWEGAQLIEKQAEASTDANFKNQQLSRAKAFYEQLAADYPNSEFAPQARERANAIGS
jgi:TolA-binding protein